MKRVGLSSNFFHADPLRDIYKGKTLLFTEKSLGDWLMSEGLMPVMVPPKTEKMSVEAIVGELDGLVLSGGADVAPESYGETPMRPEWQGDAIRDAYEIELVKAFVDTGKPVLGICRGLQLLNVAFGGTLFQDITEQNEGALIHREWKGYDQNFHEVVIEKGSQLEKILGCSSGMVNSVHHQAIKDPGLGLKVVARSKKDRIIEAAWHESQPVFGIQWHPEWQDPNNSGLIDGRPLLREFVRMMNS